jgi:hypothetical protein
MAALAFPRVFHFNRWEVEEKKKRKEKKKNERTKKERGKTHDWLVWVM